MEKIVIIGAKLTWCTTTTQATSSTKILKECILNRLNKMEKPFVTGYLESPILPTMERETNAMNDIILLRSEIAILKADLKDQDKKYNSILKAFNELIDDYIAQSERLGEVDITQVKYDWFEKAGILD
jgi:ribosome-associated translation inhibitor RaiA